VPFLTAMPAIQGEANIGEVLSATYEKHSTSVGIEVVEWRIVRANGQRLVRYGSEYVLAPEDSGATVSFTVRASADSNAPYYSSVAKTVGTD